MPNQNTHETYKNHDKTTEKEYLSHFGTASFFVPRKDANHLNAQDVVCNLVESAKDISVATWNCFEDGKDLTIKGEIVANLIFEIQTKLEMIEQLLPMAFSYQGGDE